jgi:phenylacetate-coenzyme A ligase PaaK-like adenylate-forming protein
MSWADSLILAEPNAEVPGCRRIREIKGRSDAWFVYPTNIRIHPMSLRGILGQDRHVSEYQVQQTLRGARVLAIVHGSFSPRPLERALAAALEEAGLPEAIVTVEPVTELPRHPDTHKLKRFVPLS